MTPKKTRNFVTLCFLLAACGAREPVQSETLQGSASDLGPPMMVGGSNSLTCPALNESGDMITGFEAFVSFCSEQNALLLRNGYPSCGEGQCLDSYFFQDRNSAANSSLVVRMQADLVNGGFSISFSYQWKFGGPGNGQKIQNYSCAPVAELWERETRLSRESWSFDRFLAKCLN